uniref:Uncharacterized protein n=1 Tax=Trichuris muris TaxID=70415 RepID=A0A5S6QJ84_TRIMR
MFSTLLPGLRSREIILGSASPRREEILRKLGLPFRVVTSQFAEDLDKANYRSRPADYAVENAYCKGTSVCEQLNGQPGSKVVIACDTVVYCDGKIYEKPSDAQDAYQMISELNDKEHDVFTGIVLLETGANEVKVVAKFSVATKVHLGHLTEDIISAYIATAEPFDKAGGYGIQGAGATLIKEIHGDFYNVMGLPLYALAQNLLLVYGDK